MEKRDDIIAAMNAINPDNYIPVEENDHPHFDTPERAYIKKHLVKSLTDDAKFLLRLVLDTPQELVTLLFKQNGDVKTTVLTDILSFRGWSYSRRRDVYNEIKNFIREYY